jgi:hypothetical protein
MLKKVRKKIINKALIKVLVCIAIIIGTLFITDMASIKMIIGPEKVDIDDIDLNEYDGKYIKTKITYVYDYFLEEETYTKYRNGSRSSGRITARYYITDVNESQFIALLADGNTLMDKFDDLMKETETALDNGTVPVGATYKGTFTKLTDEEYAEYKSFMDSVGLTEDDYSDYIFKANYVGSCEESDALLSFVVIGAAILFALGSIIRGFSSRYTKDLKKFATNNGITFDQLTMELDGALEVKGVWLTARYTAYLKGTKIRVIKNQDYIWAYYKETRTTRRGITNFTRQIALADRNKKFKLITIHSEEDARKILGIYAETQPQMVLGFNEDLQKLFKNNFQQFLLLPYQANAEDDEIASSEEYVPEKYVPESYTPEE